MRNLLWLLFLSLVSCQTAYSPERIHSNPPRLTSPIASSIPAIRIPNVHVVDAERGPILRGMVPYTKDEVQDLKRYGVKKILIFRNQHKNEVGIQEELSLLNEVGYHQEDVEHIPFPWRDFTGFREPCEQTIAALKFLREASGHGAGVYFHCTVGEDRTGYLAGLYQLIFKGQKLDSVYQNEMCARGYAEADPSKPPHVVELVHRNITRQFAKMVLMIQLGQFTAENLDIKSCQRDPTADAKMKPRWELLLKSLKCG